MSPTQIILALSNGDSPPLGNVWRITAKKSDFYLDPLGSAGVYHLSVHGPNDHFGGHRFHVRADRRSGSEAGGLGFAFDHNLPRHGYSFDGLEVAASAYCVARVRWTWDVQRPRYRAAAVLQERPETIDGQSGMHQSQTMKANSAWDVDFVVSYDEPFWPHPIGSLRDNARVGPLRNESGLWLTGTSYHRSQVIFPSPAKLKPELPDLNETATQILTGGPGFGGVNDMYWFIESITARENVAAAASN